MPISELSNGRSIDVFSLPTSELIKVFEEIAPPPQFFRDTFFNRELKWPTIEIDVSYRRGSQTLAPLVMEYQVARTLLRPPLQRKRIALPMFAPSRAIHPSDILLQVTPQHYFPTSDSNDFAAQLILQDQQECDNALSLTEEYSCASLLTKNEIRFAADGGTEVVLQFEGNERIVLPGDQFFDNADASPLETLNEQARVLASKCGVRPTHCVLGAAAARSFLRNPAVVKERNLMAYTNFPEAQELPDSITYLGRFSGLHVMEYNGIFQTSDGSVVDLMPPNLALLLNQNQQGLFHYGAIGQIEDGQMRFYSEKRVPLIWTENVDVYHFRLASRFCPLPADILNYQCLQVVAEASTAPPPEPGNGGGAIEAAGQKSAKTKGTTPASA